MCTVPLPVADTAEAESLQRRLWEEEGVEVPIVAWQDQFFVRVSIQAYNSRRDVDRLLDGLVRLL
jgi:isopenicillin-N epimerase